MLRRSWLASMLGIGAATTVSQSGKMDSGFIQVVSNGGSKVTFIRLSSVVSVSKEFVLISTGEYVPINATSSNKLLDALGC